MRSKQIGDWNVICDCDENDIETRENWHFIYTLMRIAVLPKGFLSKNEAAFN